MNDNLIKTKVIEYIKEDLHNHQSIGNEPEDNFCENIMNGFIEYLKTIPDYIFME